MCTLAATASSAITVSRDAGNFRLKQASPLKFKDYWKLGKTLKFTNFKFIWVCCHFATVRATLSFKAAAKFVTSSPDRKHERKKKDRRKEGSRRKKEKLPLWVLIPNCSFLMSWHQRQMKTTILFGTDRPPSHRLNLS
jgi:hypothetical protein